MINNYANDVILGLSKNRAKKIKKSPKIRTND